MGGWGGWGMGVGGLGGWKDWGGECSCMILFFVLIINLVVKLGKEERCYIG